MTYPVESLTVEDVKCTVERLDFSKGDVLLVKVPEGEWEKGCRVADKISSTGALPVGTPIMVLSDQIDIEALRNAPPEAKEMIKRALD